MDLKKRIRIVEDFPKPGISFKDITTLIADGEAFKYSIDAMAKHLKDKNIDLAILKANSPTCSDLGCQLHMH